MYGSALDVPAALLTTLAEYFDPGAYNTLAAMLAVIVIINPLPLIPRVEDETALDFLLIWSRRLLLLAILLFMFALPPALFLLFGLVYNEHYADVDRAACEWLLDTAQSNWWRPALGVVMGTLFKAVYERYVWPELSSWFRSQRVLTVTDKMSDVRIAFDELKLKSYDPRS